MSAIAVSAQFPTSAPVSVPHWWPVPTAAFVSGSHRFSPACAGKCAEVEGGAEAWTAVQSFPTGGSHCRLGGCPILELTEFLKDFRGSFPQVDLVAGWCRFDATAEPARTSSPGIALRHCAAARIPILQHGTAHPQ